MEQVPVQTTQKNNTRKIVAIFLLVGPTALWIILLMTYAISNFMLGGSIQGDYLNVAHRVFNIILFVIGMVAFISWLPGIIIGSILLATKPRRQTPPSA